MQADSRVLIVDDQEEFTRIMGEILAPEGYAIERAFSGPEALQILALHRIDLVLLDLIMPVMHGLDALIQIKRDHPALPVIVLTGDAQVHSAVEAMKQGAYDYLTKPVDWERLKILIKNALHTSSLQNEVSRLKGELKEKVGFGDIVGVSRRMQEVFGSVEKVIRSDVTLSLRGESGTGKEMLARAIHFNGPRCKQPFVAVNCGAIPESLLESELFGHERGAFTGAVTGRPGKFEQATGGTIFLDEIGEMTPATQVKMLRVLQERKIERVGGSKPIDVDVRVISATNKNLEREMETGNFREDLYYRINVYPIILPPLRERKEDIPTLVAVFMRKFHEKSAHRVAGVSSKAMEYLLNYHWPGNVRELENVMERAILNASDGPILPEHLPVTLTSGNAASASFGAMHFDFRSLLGLSKNIVPLEDIEKEALAHALKVTNYNMSTTASALGIGRTTLYRKVHKYGIQVPRLNYPGLVH